MRFVHLAAGLGLALLQTTSASALQHRVRDHSASQHSARHPAVRHADRSADRAARRTAYRRVHKKDSVATDDTESLSGLKREVRDLRKQLEDLEGVRQELTEFKQKIWGPVPFSLALVGKPAAPAPAQDRSAGLVDTGGGTLSLPNTSEPQPDVPRRPEEPSQASLPAVIDNRALEKLQAKSAVEEAKAYVLATAHPGDSMRRQGASLAVERLHPALIVRLAAAIKRARAAGLTEAGIFSAYRPPGFHIGGFKDKFKSLHAYGLAIDMTGIGHAGSASARLWKTIAEDAGLCVPYGAANHAEFNHTQLISAKAAPDRLQATIAATGPTDLRRMWLASGIGDYVLDVQPTRLAALAPPSSDESSGNGEIAVQPGQKAGKRKAERSREKPSRRTASKGGEDRKAQRSAERKHRGESTRQRVRAAEHEAKPRAHRKKSPA